ncbi:MarR family transcriptional regulator [Altererythrobacter endophyticus]|uniref:MarR family transcriptional regulator n=2 Tax=Altericroceibacterium endophyticum TaxID=1808508 RepID=A0A6I4SZW9_9SPHN|nr:MarR family transcriptional regulator [Altericroceibacterium endophyticum]
MQAATSAFVGAGLSPSLGTVVLVVSRHGAQVSQKDLAVEVGVNPAALVRTLDRGEAAGLLQRCDVPNDRRSKNVELLPEGLRLAEMLETRLNTLRHELLGDLPEEDLQTAIRVLRLMEERAQAFVNQDKE